MGQFSKKISYWSGWLKLLSLSVTCCRMRSAAAKFEDWIPSLTSPPQVDPTASNKDTKDPKPYRSHPPQPPGAVSDTEGEPVVNVSLLSALQNKTTRKQTQLSDNRGGDLGWTPRREFYLFPYFSVIPRLCVRLSSGNFKDLNGAISTIIVICGL